MTDEVSGNDAISSLGNLLGSAGRIVALTGAGISTESGIPDFRGPGGLWTRVKPITFGEFVQSEAARLEDWRRRFAMNEVFARATPNAGHRALAFLAREGRLSLLVTQNIDGLHQRAGLDPGHVLEIHGNATHGHCLDCGLEMPLAVVRSLIDARGQSPRCACGGLVKSAVISFGEKLPEARLRRAFEEAQRTDLFLVIGSSLTVQPAATIPLSAKRAGACLAILNMQETSLDGAADLVVRAPIGSVFSHIYPQVLG